MVKVLLSRKGRDMWKSYDLSVVIGGIGSLVLDTRLKFSMYCQPRSPFQNAGQHWRWIRQDHCIAKGAVKGGCTVKRSTQRWGKLIFFKKVSQSQFSKFTQFLSWSLQTKAVTKISIGRGSSDLIRSFIMPWWLSWMARSEFHKQWLEETCLHAGHLLLTTTATCARIHQFLVPASPLHDCLDHCQVQPKSLGHGKPSSPQGRRGKAPLWLGFTIGKGGKPAT